MKITPADNATLAQLIGEVKARISPMTRAQHHATLKQESRYKDNPDRLAMRFRWDMFACIPQAKRAEWTDKVYKYANDTHIDTALKKIVELPQ